MEPNKDLPELGPLVVRLLRGALYRDQSETLWHDLMALQARVIDYVRVLGLELAMDEAEGYAYLKQSGADEMEETGPPRLIQRRALSYPVSLILVLLRKKMVETDAGGGDSRVILSREQIVEMVRVFFPDQTNEAKLVDKIDTHINKVVSLGFLRQLKKGEHLYEIRRIIKALVDADWLADLEEKLTIYREYAIGDN